MKKMILVLAAFLTLSACKDEEKSQTVVVAGDSWAMFVCIYKSMDKALDNAGVKNAKSNKETCAVTTHNGVKAQQWLETELHTTTSIALADPNVKVLYLSLGGNDLMNFWNKSMTPAEAQAVLDGIAVDVQKVIAAYKEKRPDIKILLSGYDFPRFTADHPIDGYREAYEDMGSPTPLELNNILVQFSDTLAKVADNKNVFYIHHLGLMHYYYGNSAQGLAPKTTLSPEKISSRAEPTRIGGDVRLQTDAEAMLQAGPVVDAFHLSKSGFQKLVDHCVDTYIKDWLQ